MGGLSLALTLDAGCLDPLAGLYDRLGDLTPAMEGAGRLMLASAAKNFAAQGRPDKWRPLAPSTVKRKGNGIILFETGRLMSSIGFSAGCAGLSVSARVPYAAIQQDGGRAGARLAAVIPARPFLFFQPEDARAIGELIAGYLQD